MDTTQELQRMSNKLLFVRYGLIRYSSFLAEAECFRIHQGIATGKLDKLSFVNKSKEILVILEYLDPALDSIVSHVSGEQRASARLRHELRTILGDDQCLVKTFWIMLDQQIDQSVQES